MIINQMSYFITHFFLLLGILFTIINGECVQLTNSKSCPGFKDYSIDTTNGIFPLASTPHYTDVTSFDSYINKYSDFLAKYFITDLVKDSTCTSEQIVNMEKEAISNLRYLTTFACNFIIISDKNQCQPVKPKVCKTTCNDFITSYQGFIDKYKTCLNPTVLSKNLESHNNRCTKSSSNFSGSSDCIGSTNESNCGYKSSSGLASYCENSSDSCCSEKNEAALNPDPTLTDTTPTIQQPVVTSTNTVAQIENATNSVKEQNESKPRGSKLWIFITAGCALLVVSALVYFYKKGESLDSENKSFNEDRFPPFQSMNDRGFNSSGG